jgi:hypothetical protein
MNRHAGLLSIPLLLVLSGAVCAAPPPAHEKGSTPAMDSPFEIRPTLARNLTLKAVLHNRSGVKQWVLHDLLLQPSELVVTDAQGEALRPSDARNAMKFDNTVRRESFTSVAPNASLELFDTQAVKKDGSYQLKWGPYRFSGLAPGEYRARIRWTSAKRNYVDEDGTARPMDGVWLGTVTSAEFAVHLP